MKYMDNPPLLMRDGKPAKLSIPADPDYNPDRAPEAGAKAPELVEIDLTPRDIFRITADSLPAEQMDLKVLGVALAAVDSMKKQDAKGAALLSLEDDQYSLLRPIVNKHMARMYRLSAPGIVAELDKRLEAGTALAEAEEVAAGAAEK